MTGVVHVLAAPVVDPAMGRVEMTVNEGASLADIVRAAVPGVLDAHLKHFRVMLVTAKGATAVSHERWARVKPKAGVHVVIRRVPGKNALRPILQVVVAIAAIAAGIYFAPLLAGTFGLSAGVWGQIIFAGVSAIGNLAINALVPPQRASGGAGNGSSAADRQAGRQAYAISGYRNPATPDGYIPNIFGKHRYAPPFGAMSYSEIIGDEQYIRFLFVYGYGPLEMSDHKIGETSISAFTGLEYEVRQGLPGDAPLTWYTNQVIEESVGTELIRPLPRDGAGNVISGASIETPVRRFTASDVASARVILGFGSGLVSFDNSGNEQALSVVARVRYRPAAGGDWVLVQEPTITAKKRDAFYRDIAWTFPQRGTYEIEVTRMTEERTSAQVADRMVLFAIQSIRPEYPINMDKPMAMIAGRIKSSYQLNGPLDSWNSICERLAPDWDSATGTWITRKTRNPASLFRLQLQGNSNAYPKSDSEIDLAALQDWHEFCTAKGLKYDRVVDFELSWEDHLAQIAAAGRASPRDDGKRWSVVIDRPQELVVDHINPRNSRDFRWTRTYFDPPHGIRVRFVDETNGYNNAERIVRWPGFSGAVTITEELELPGKTDPDEIYRETRRRMYELQYRPDRFTALQDGLLRVATRGDLVAVSYDVLARTQQAGRVKAVFDGQGVMLDSAVEMLAGEVYAIRFRVYADEADAIGTSVVRRVRTIAGETDTVWLTEGDEHPAVGEIVHFGPLATESEMMIVKGVESGDDMTAMLTMISAAPIIDELTDADTPPAWTGRVGAELDPEALAPAVPRFAGVLTGIVGTGAANGLVVQLAAGTTGTVPTSTIQLQHRLFGSSTWTTVSIPIADGGTSITGYAVADVVELRARALAPDGTPSLYTNPVTVTIGSNDGATPAALPSETIAIEGRLGRANVTFVTGSDSATAQVQIYRNTSGTLDRSSDVVGPAIPTVSSTSFTLVDGDATRTNLLVNPGFDSASDWTADANWSIASGVATHAPGAADEISQAVALVEGAVYRLAFTVSAATDGDVSPRLSGGSDVDGDPVDADGRYLGSLTAVSGNDAFGFVADSDFDGSLDNVVLYRQTAQCLPQGTVHYWLEPQNENGVPGPVSGPISITII